MSKQAAYIRSMNTELNEMESEKAAIKTYCDEVAKHLSTNYMYGVWGFYPTYSNMSKTDMLAMEKGYKYAVKHAVNIFEESLWFEVKHYLGLKKVKGKTKPSWDRVKEILLYKTVGKTKRAIRKYLYS